MTRDKEYMRLVYQVLRDEGFSPEEARRMRTWSAERILKAIEERKQRGGDKGEADH